jgi:uncharacterized glyoxalase superfamily protein PhnB
MSDLPPPPTVWPSLKARDARAMIRFLVDVLGFEETIVYGDGDHVDHAELAWPLGGGVMLGSPDDPGDPHGQPLHVPGSFACYVVTDDVDALFERAQAAGVEAELPPYDTDYGSRDVRFRDPEGNRWSFGTYAGHPRQG